MWRWSSFSGRRKYCRSFQRSSSLWTEREGRKGGGRVKDMEAVMVQALARSLVEADVRVKNKDPRHDKYHDSCALEYGLRLCGFRLGAKRARTVLLLLRYPSPRPTATITTMRCQPTATTPTHTDHHHPGTQSTTPSKRVPSRLASAASTPSAATPRAKSAASPASSARPSALPRPSPLRPRSVPMAAEGPRATIST